VLLQGALVMAIAAVIDEQLDIVPWMQLQSASSGPEPATLSAMGIMVAIIIFVIVLIFMVAARGLGLGGDKVVGGAQHGACDASASGQHEGVFGFAADTSGEAMLIDEVGREFGPDIGCHGWKSDTGEDADTAQGNGESGRFRHCRFSFRGLGDAWIGPWSVRKGRTSGSAQQFAAEGHCWLGVSSSADLSNRWLALDHGNLTPD
jgi:hypothetical protein